MDSLFDRWMEGNLPGSCVLFLADGAQHGTQIQIFLRQLPGAQIQAGHVQQALGEQGHFLGLAVNDVNGLPVFFQVIPVLLDVAALGKDDGGGGSELMGSIGGKLLFRFKGLFQAREHVVKSIGQPFHFQITFDGQGDSLGQIPPFADTACGVGNVGDRGQGLFYNEVSAHCRGENKEGQYHGEDKEYLINGLASVRAAQDAAEPITAVPAGGNPEVQNVKSPIVSGDKSGNAIFQLCAYRKGRRGLSGEKILPRTVRERMLNA